MTRAAPVLLVLAVALAACNAQPQKAKQAAASSAHAASSAPATPAPPAHRYAFQNGDQYGYMSAAHVQVGQEGEAAQQPVIVRYLGMQDGVYTIAEVQDGAIVVAQCSAPCQQVRIRGKDLDQTLDLNPSSIVYAALTDAINGQLQVYKPKTTAKKP
ncbi:MAG TPA: hypothetical protein VGM25_11040 [Caulobacteraceae bacterium]